MKKAFSMFTAIFIMILMSLLAVFILNMSAKSVKATVVNYKKEQAALYAKSYTELAIMAATANDSNVSDCAENINGYIGGDQTEVEEGKGYEVQTRIAYIGNDLQCSTSSSILPANRVLNDQTIDIDTLNALHIIVDVYVRYKPSIDVDAGSSKWITYHRRTLQKL